MQTYIYLASLVQWQNARLPCGRPGFDSRTMHSIFSPFEFLDISRCALLRQPNRLSLSKNSLQKIADSYLFVTIYVYKVIIYCFAGTDSFFSSFVRMIYICARQNNPFPPENLQIVAIKTWITNTSTEFLGLNWLVPMLNNCIKKQTILLQTQT